MILTEKEATSIKDLQTQEETCIKKYEILHMKQAWSDVYWRTIQN